MTRELEYLTTMHWGERIENKVQKRTSWETEDMYYLQHEWLLFAVLV